jgi:pimeloyl-ACP methyl ester carboxylesterase
MAVPRHAEPSATALIYVQNGPVRLGVECLGSPNAPPILFLHGFPEHRGAWRAVAERFANDFYCILPDLRGYGASDKPDAVSAYTIRELLTDIAALIDFTGHERISIAGHDWGGVLAYWFAARFPQRVMRLIVAGAPHPLLLQRRIIDDPAQRLASQYITRLRSPVAAQNLLGNGAPAFWDAMFASNPVYTDRQRDEYIASWEVPGAISAMLKWYQAAPFIVPEPEIAAQLPDWANSEDLIVQAPTLILWGMKDHVFMPSLQDQLDEVVPKHSLQRFDDADHAIIHEKPTALTHAIRSFLTP